MKPVRVFLLNPNRSLEKKLSFSNDRFGIKIDNNLAENEIRPITLGRKNYLFCGNHEAAENMCVISSLLSTSRNHDVNPREYLNDIISRMPYMEKASHEQLVELLPHKWKLIPHEPAVTLPTDGKPFVTKEYR